MHILLIEDELPIALDLIATLEAGGFSPVTHSATEHEALARIPAKAWDLALLDANLNGHSVERILRALQAHSVPFLIVTGYGRGFLPSEVGEAPVVTKPFSPTELLRQVRALHP